MKHLIAAATLAAVFSTSAYAGPHVAAQPITNLNTLSKKDTDDDADPFNIQQIDTRVFFFAKNNKGYGLYVRDLAIRGGLNDGQLDETVDLTLKKHTPTLLKQFSKNQLWDDQVVVLESYNLGSFSPRPTEGTMFFHVPSQGLWSSKGTTGTTKKLLDVDLGTDPDTYLHYLTTVRANVVGEARVYYSGNAAKTGIELYQGKGGSKPSTKLFSNAATGNTSSFPFLLTSSFTRLYFAAVNPTADGVNIYRTDGSTLPQLAAEDVGQLSELVGDGNGGAWYVGPESAQSTALQKDLFHVDPQGNIKQFTTGGKYPYYLTMLRGQLIFTMFVSGSGYGVYSADPLNDEPSLLHSISPTASSAPGPYVVAGLDWVYFTASTEAGGPRKLFRSSGNPSGLEQVFEQGTGKAIVFNENPNLPFNSEIMPVIQVDGNDQNGEAVYFTGTPAGTATQYLFVQDAGHSNTPAIAVRTPLNNKVTNARHLAKFVATGLSGTYRLFFSCDGTGTGDEFYSQNADAPSKTKPRGFELWTTEVGN